MNHIRFCATTDATVSNLRYVDDDDALLEQVLANGSNISVPCDQIGEIPNAEPQYPLTGRVTGMMAELLQLVWNAMGDNWTCTVDIMTSSNAILYATARQKVGQQ